MVHGVPVITSNVGGISEAISEQEGILLQTTTSNTLEDAINTLIQNPKERLRMGVQCQSKIEQFFTLDQMCKQTQAVYLSILQK